MLFFFSCPSSNKYLLNVHHVSDTVLESRYPKVNKTLRGIALVEIKSRGREKH